MSTQAGRGPGMKVSGKRVGPKQVTPKVEVGKGRAVLIIKGKKMESAECGSMALISIPDKILDPSVIGQFINLWKRSQSSKANMVSSRMGRTRLAPLASVWEK